MEPEIYFRKITISPFRPEGLLLGDKKVFFWETKWYFLTRLEGNQKVLYFKNTEKSFLADQKKIFSYSS